MFGVVLLIFAYETLSLILLVGHDESMHPLEDKRLSDSGRIAVGLWVFLHVVLLGMLFIDFLVSKKKLCLMRSDVVFTHELHHSFSVCVPQHNFIVFQLL